MIFIHFHRDADFFKFQIRRADEIARYLKAREFIEWAVRDVEFLGLKSKKKKLRKCI